MSLAELSLALSIFSLMCSVYALANTYVPHETKGFKWTGWVKAKNAEPTNYHVVYSGEHPDKAVFIMPDRVSEILSAKPGASLDEVITY